jgi:hypothetical protein
MNREKYLSIESPDASVTIDFLGVNSRRKKDRRACTVVLKVENGRLWVQVKGCDDRATILVDTFYDLPEEDRRR